MSTIIQEITRLQNAKSSLKSSLEAKGVTVASDATLDAYPALVDSIPSGGGGSVEQKDVNFYDYEGTRLYSYTKQEFLALSALPDNPDRTSEGLTAQGWNWSLSDAKSYVAYHGLLDIGQMYTPTDGKTKLVLDVTDGFKGVSITLNLAINAFSGTRDAVINWGDGTEETITISPSTCQFSKIYNTKGIYTISLDYSDNSDLILGGGTHLFNDNYRFPLLLKSVILNEHSHLGYSSLSSCANLEKVVISRPLTQIKSIEGRSFSLIYNSKLLGKLKHVTIPLDFTSISANAFYDCSFESVSIPNGIVSIGENAFNSCVNLNRIEFPDTMTSTNYNLIANCCLLKRYEIPNNVSFTKVRIDYLGSLEQFMVPDNIDEIVQATYDDYCLRFITCKPTVPPKINSNFIAGQTQDFIAIYVPASVVDTYKAAENWSTYADKIFPIPTE